MNEEGKGAKSRVRRGWGRESLRKRDKAKPWRREGKREKRVKLVFVFVAN